MRSGVERHCFSVKCGLPRHFKGCPCVLWEMGQRGKFLYVSYNGFAGWSPSLFYFKLAEANLAGTETPVSHRNASNKSHCFFATGKSESSVAFWKMPSKVCLGNRPSWQQINAVNKQINQRNAVVWKVDFFTSSRINFLSSSPQGPGTRSMPHCISCSIHHHSKAANTHTEVSIFQTYVLIIC